MSFSQIGKNKSMEANFFKNQDELNHPNNLNYKVTQSSSADYLNICYCKMAILEVPSPKVIRWRPSFLHFFTV